MLQISQTLSETAVFLSYFVNSAEFSYILSINDGVNFWGKNAILQEIIFSEDSLDFV